MVREFFGEVFDIITLGKYLGVSERTIHRLLKKGELRGSKIGRQWRFRKQNIDEWLKWSKR